MTAAFIMGVSGPVLTAWERDFIREAQPWGFILFDRNLTDADQIRALNADLRQTVGADAPILIDQEGGRVQRLRPPLAEERMPPLDFMRLPAEKRAQAMALRYRHIAYELHDLGIDVNCAPMLDVPEDETHPFLMNRCYSRDPGEIAEIGRAVMQAHLAGGVLPIAKHIPGHGRGTVDSHFGLPVVDADLDELQRDFAPFAALSDIRMAMTAHVVYTALDAQACATLSPVVVRYIRDVLGFDGLLMTDDLSMHALGGSFEGRVRGSLDAGCDMILHCNGDPAEMVEIAAAVPVLSGPAAARAEAALAERRPPEPFDAQAASVALAALEAEARDA